MRRHNRRLPGPSVKSHVNPDDPMVKKACTSKRKYSTKPRASHAAHGAERKSGLETSFYHCRYCGRYHLSRVRDAEGNFIPVARNLIPAVSKMRVVQ